MAQVDLIIEERIARVHLNRPEARNALTPEMDARLFEIWQRLDADPDVWCIVLTAAGDEAFCIGADVGARSADTPRLAVGGGLTGIGGPLLRLAKPLVAAVQGYCVGAGFELAMCADIIVAAHDAEFGLPETRRGIIGECGVVHRAVRRLPHAIAMALILTGERIDAATAAQHGLVNQVVAPADLTAAAMSWAARISKASPLANRAAKAAVAKGLQLPLEAALQLRVEEIEAYAHSADARERDEALAQQRWPVWTGR